MAGWLAAAAALWAQPYIVSSAAGGTAPVSPAPGVNTGIYEPGGLATDAAGNVYFASLNYVFRLGRDGMLTRVAGTPPAGFSGDGGLAVNAQLSNSYGVAMDGAGDLYIGDTGNNRIRRIAPSGIIATVAGTGTRSNSGDGGPAAVAQVDLGSGAVMAADRAGNLYFGGFEGIVIRGGLRRAGQPVEHPGPGGHGGGWQRQPVHRRHHLDSQCQRRGNRHHHRRQVNLPHLRR